MAADRREAVTPAAILDLDSLVRRLRAAAGAESEVASIYDAAVALCLREGERGGTEILLVERARRAGDPWSGHMAFPGGRRQGEDGDALDTALRETCEEVGVDVPRSSFVGWLEPQTSPRRTPGGAITIVAGVVDCRQVRTEPLDLNHEIADADWVPMDHLVDPGRRLDYEYPPMPGSRFDAIELVAERPVVWGLTFRFLEDFLGRVMG